VDYDLIIPLNPAFVTQATEFQNELMELICTCFWVSYFSMADGDGGDLDGEFFFELDP
jgi:hypothetical protein